jgi:Zinc knuckle
MVPMNAHSNDGIAFANVGDNEHAFAQGSKKNEKDKGHITCFKCNNKGHYANECPNDKESGTTMLMNGNEMEEPSSHIQFQFLQHSNEYVFHKQNNYHHSIPKTWILLDNQSTIDVFSNPQLLQNIHEVKHHLDIHCNAGITSTNLKGDLPGYGTVWYHPKGIANILSLSRVKENGYRVTYDSNNDTGFTITKPDGSTRMFKESNKGLFYLDTTSHSTVLVNTVANNRSQYTNRDYAKAVLARQIQCIIGRPSTANFIKIVENNLLPNCPITGYDIKAAEHIFGPDIGSLKGKTVRQSPNPVNVSITDIPSTIMDRYRDVTLAGDIMFVNTIPFFVSISRDLKFATAEMICNQKDPTILLAIKHVVATYAKRGFRVATILMDGQFDSLRGDLSELHLTLNTTANDEHVPEIERHIRTIKERARSIYNTLPFKQLPPRLVIELVYYCTFWLNSFPNYNGVSTTLSPRTIVTGLTIDYNNHCQLEFGAYVQTHEAHDNSMATRTTGAIALRPTGNQQGTFYFYSLTTGRILTRNHWTSLPMPAEVIDRIHVLSRRGRGRPAGFHIAARDGIPLLDDDDDNYDDPDDTSWHPHDAENDDYDDFSHEDDAAAAADDDNDNNDDDDYDADADEDRIYDNHPADDLHGENNENNVDNIDNNPVADIAGVNNYDEIVDENC